MACWDELNNGCFLPWLKHFFSRPLPPSPHPLSNQSVSITYVVLFRHWSGLRSSSTWLSFSVCFGVVP